MKNVNKILAKHINESAVSGGAIGQGSKALDTESTWRTLRDQADHLALEIEEVQLSKKFGATYASYVKLRRLQRIVKRSKSPRYFNEAIKLCEEIEESDPESQFAAAAGYLKAQLLLKNPTQDPKKAIKEAKEQLNKFVKSNPEGLYRGEALMLLGKISLEKEWDAKDAEKYYSQALTWFKQAREKREAMSLYAPMSNDLKTQTKATQKPTTLNKWKRTVYHQEDPLRLYNTASAPPWYVSDKEKNCIFALGFCKYLNEDYEGASKVWHELPGVDENLSYLNGTIFASTAKRLYAACYNKHMGMTSEEKGRIKDKKIAIMIKFAELLYLQEKFTQSIDMFKKIAAMAKADNQIKFICWAGIGACYGAIPEKPKDMEYYKKALAFKKFEKNSLYPEVLYRYADSLMGYAYGAKKAIPLLKTYLKKYPDGRHVFQVWYNLVHAYVYCDFANYS
ncbi:MAG: hypothetical protein KAS17_07480, partial [Victivallaceae bacterium]|nr:hypothetical protein [Victivallaceae bacterium]